MMKKSLIVVFVVLPMLLCCDYSGNESSISAEKMSKAPQIEERQNPYFIFPETEKVINGIPYTIVHADRKWISLLYEKQDFAAVGDHIFELLAKGDDNSNACQLTLLYHHLSQILDRKNTQVMESILNDWVQRDQASHIPWLVRGFFYINYAWAVRGTGWSKDVSQEAMVRFKGLLRKAKENLKNSIQRNPADPNAWARMIVVAKGLSLPKEEMDNYYQLGLATRPCHFDVCNTKLSYLMPKWHGSRKEMMDFAMNCLNSSDQNPYLGFIMVNALDEMGKSILREKHYLNRDEVWPIIKSIYANFFKKYPDDLRRRFNYAYHCYWAQKYDIALKQFEIIGNRYIPDTEWSSVEHFNKIRAITYARVGEKYLIERRLYAISIDFFVNAATLHPDDYTLLRLGQAYMYAGLRQRSLDYVRRGESHLRKAASLNGPNQKIVLGELRKLNEYKK